jgi:WD40 repeat protein
VAQTVAGNTPQGPTTFEHDLVFTPDGKTVIIANNGGRVGYWNVQTGDIEWSDSLLSSSINALAVSRDGKRLALGGAPNMNVYDMNTGELLWSHSGLYRFDDVQFSRDNSWLACANANGVVTLVSTADWSARQISEEVPGGGNYAWALAFSPDSKRLAGVTYRNEIKIWDTKSGMLLSTWPGSGRDHDGITSVAYSPDGRLLLISNGQNSPGPLELRDARTGTVLHTLASKLSRGTVSFTSDGKQVVAGDASKSLAVWDIAGLTVPSDEPATLHDTP